MCEEEDAIQALDHQLLPKVLRRAGVSLELASRLDGAVMKEEDKSRN